MSRLAASVVLAGGWRRWLLAFAAGALGALAMPPFGLLPALVVALTIAVWLLDGAVGEGAAPRRSALLAAAAAGWWWGFGYFAAGLWWLGAAFLVEAELFAWAMPLGVLGLPAVLALFMGLGFALARLLWSPGPVRIVSLAVGLTVGEAMRGALFTGFPWNPLGLALGQHLWLMQAASLVGIHGLTLLTVLIGASPATLAGGRRRSRDWWPLAAAASALAAIALFGALRVPSAPMPGVAGVRLRVMQPNLPQDAKFNPRNAGAIMQRYLALSDQPGDSGRGIAGATHLVWPESAFPFLLHRAPQALAQIADLLPPGTTLLTGAARLEEPLPGEVDQRFFNSIQVVRDDGTITGSYDKVHLVPFGEYLPRAFDAALRAVGLREFVHVPGGFTAADRRRALVAPGLPPVAATICYEAIFTRAVLPDGPRPQLILNVTNDAWFGNTPGPHQHFAQARLRAVEEGLPLVRAANTGISAVVDPYGRVIRSLPLGVEGVLDANLPIALAAPPYSGLGSTVPIAMVLACLAVILTARRRRRSFPASPETSPAARSPEKTRP